MPTFEDPAADADEAQQSLRGLAHATRSIHDPNDIYPTLGSLSRAAASMSQSLHQLGPSQLSVVEASVTDGVARAG